MIFLFRSYMAEVRNPAGLIIILFRAFRIVLWVPKLGCTDYKESTLFLFF